mgnify:CR=1 FL=1
MRRTTVQLPTPAPSARKVLHEQGQGFQGQQVAVAPQGLPSERSGSCGRRRHSGRPPRGARRTAGQDRAHPGRGNGRGDAFDRLVGGSHHDPHGLLGAHPTADGRTVIRTLRPEASKVTAIIEGKPFELERLHAGGVFGAVVDGLPTDYRLEVAYGDETYQVDDPYRWLPTLGEVDLHLIGEGRHEQLWDVLGAHERTYDTPQGPVSGTSFAVWAPNARGVRVVGDFDYWSGRDYPMRSLGSSGVWELFVPGVGKWSKYKFSILGADSVWRQKADPMAFATEAPPATASMVFTSGYEWGDDEWLAARAGTQWHSSPMSIYEVHIGSWRQGLSYSQLAEDLVAHVKATGFTHVEFLPVAEHPFGGSWGYQVSSYYAPSARFGNPDDFRYLVDRLHQAGIGVIVDWVPAHFPKDEWALARFDGTALYEHSDPRRGEQPDWGTLRFRLRPPRGAQLPRGQRRCSGSRSSTSMGYGSTPSPRCSTSTTPARTASGCPTSTAAGRTSTLSASCKR